MVYSALAVCISLYLHCYSENF